MKTGKMKTGLAKNANNIALALLALLAGLMGLTQ